ncbi:MAG TPA: response regulator transcription factor [Gallionella sp.]|jgi:DNA-binding NarL/FixJ family response regulator|nr:response regulator transcription factor [Gallionella sp.]
MKVLVVDDHALFREGMRHMLLRLPEPVEILEAGNFPDGLKIAAQHPELDLALLDLNMPGSEGPISIRFFHRHYPHIPVVVVSGEEGRGCMEKVMNYGAMGFMCKSSSAAVMLSALNLVLSGGVYVPPEMLRQHGVITQQEPEVSDRRSLRTNEYGLTSRQMEVLRHLSAGMSNKEIAEAIHLAEGTIKIHVAAVYQTLRVSNRMEAVRAAEKLGLIGATNG